MTGGWHDESARHALAAKGIPTSAGRIARGYHTSRPLQERLDDEMRIEPYVEDIALWAQNPDEYDIKGIDDPVLEGFHINQVLLGDSFQVFIHKDDEKNPDKWAGTLSAIYKGEFNDVRYYVFVISVDSDHRGIGLSRYLLRHSVNLADKMGVGMIGHVSPHSNSPIDKETLTQYYGSYGFTTSVKEHTGSNYFDIVRPPQPEEGSLIE